MLNDSHKKRKHSLETRSVLLTLFLDIEIEVAAQGIHQSIEKWLLSGRNLFPLFSFIPFFEETFGKLQIDFLENYRSSNVIICCHSAAL